jgi:hypothetical protein
MPIAVTSYLFLSRAEKTEAAEQSETSCSPDLPPYKTPILIFDACRELAFCRISYP